MSGIRLIAVVLTISASFVAGCGDSGSSSQTAATTTSARAEPVLATAAALQTFAGALDHPVYWVRDETPGKYELTQADQRTYIRYLPSNVDIGDPGSDFLTVGTYARTDAAESVSQAAAAAGSTSGRMTDGTLVVVRADQPKSAFFAVPKLPYLVEVFSPTPGQAVDLVTSGRVVPIR